MRTLNTPPVSSPRFGMFGAFHDLARTAQQGQAALNDYHWARNVGQQAENGLSNLIFDPIGTLTTEFIGSSRSRHHQFEAEKQFRAHNYDAALEAYNNALDSLPPPPQGGTAKKHYNESFIIPYRTGAARSLIRLKLHDQADIHTAKVQELAELYPTARQALNDIRDDERQFPRPQPSAAPEDSYFNRAWNWMFGQNNEERA